MPVRLVVDSSVTMAWCLQDEHNRYADQVLGCLRDGGAVVPGIWPLEIGNTLVVAERRRRVSQADGTRFLELLSTLNIVVEPEPASRVFSEIVGLAREFNLTTYDASYLDLAMRAGLPLASHDMPLRKAAAKCAVPLFDPEDIA